MTHELLLAHLADAAGPLTARDLASASGEPTTAEVLASIELIAFLATEVRREGNGWILRADTPSRRVLAALRAYAVANPTRAVFLASAALGALAAHEQPTEERLRQLLASSADFKLLPNAMIKRVS